MFNYDYDDYITIGPTPAEEDCAQLGQENYRKLAKMEMQVYINQLERQFADWVWDGYISFGMKWFNHDFGTYGEVVVKYNTKDEVSVKYAFSVDSNIPYNWDEQSLKELEKLEYEALLR